MKRRLFALLCACACVIGASAHDYDHSIGGTVGSLYGVSYKGFFAPAGDKGSIGIIGDLGVHLIATAGPRYMIPDVEPEIYSTTYTFFTFELNPNVVYQSEIAEFDTGRVDWFAGIGTSMGLSSGFDTRNGVGGKFGMNAIGGAEVVFDAPVNLSLDFRPGYGLQFMKQAGISYFDWAVVASVRYRF